MMPRCDGPQFRKEQQQDPAIAEIPVVLLTADRTLGEEIAQLRAQDHLRKPVQLELLLQVIRRYCG
jgi:two-component system chemotaxis response regulator CheY